MRSKSLLLLIIALGCGIVASVAVSQVMSEQKVTNEVRTVGVLVMTKDVSAMTKITADNIKIEQWPAERVPMGAISDSKLVEGKYSKQRLYANEPIIEAKLSARGKDLVVPPGYQIFDLKVDDSNGGSGYIGPGDRVDVNGFFEKGNRFPISKSVRVMKNVEVAMVDGVPYRDPEATVKKANTIQLLVQDRQYEALDTANNLGKLKLSLRPPESDVGGNSKAEPELDNGDSFLSWLADNEAKKSEPSSKSESAENLMAGVLDALKPKNEDRHEMAVITPSGTSVYRWETGKKLPQKVDPNEEKENKNNPYASLQPQFPMSYKQNVLPGSNGTRPVSTFAPPAGKGEGKTGSEGKPAGDQKSGANQINSTQSLPVDPTNLVQPNLTWDPNTSTWQSGGFKPTYPGLTKATVPFMTMSHLDYRFLSLRSLAQDLRD